MVGKPCHEYSGLVETFALFVLSKEIGLLMCFTPKIGEGDHGFETYYICSPVGLQASSTENICIWVFPQIVVETPPNHPFVHRLYHEIK